MFVAHDRKEYKNGARSCPRSGHKGEKEDLSGPPHVYTRIYTYIKVALLPAAALVTSILQSTPKRKVPVQKSMPSVRPSADKQVGALPELVSRSREP
jgi:hypothetical protein